MPEETGKKVRDLISGIPKVDLHCHLDGSLRVETIRDLALKLNHKLPTYDPEELSRYVQVCPGCRSLPDFLKTFDFFYPLLKNPDAVERITYELLEDASRENIVYLEMRLAPVLQTSDSFPMEEVIRSVIRGKETAEKSFPVKSGILLCVYRGTSEDAQTKTVELAEKFRDRGVVGLDLAGDESRYPASLYQAAFRKAREFRIPVTIHAGEAAGSESISKAMELLEARRIGHGIRLKDDPLLLRRVMDSGITLEMCPTSNVQTQVVESYEKHPLPQYYKEGVRVTVNTDDRGVSGIDLSHEWNIVMEKMKLRLDDLLDMNINAIEAAFIDSSSRKTIERHIQEKIREIMNDKE